MMRKAFRSRVARDASAILFCACILMLYQDCLGMEAWIEKIRSGWVSAYVTVPLALVFLVSVLCRQAWLTIIENEEREESECVHLWIPRSFHHNQCRMCGAIKLEDD